jgi:hypothetical protein
MKYICTFETFNTQKIEFNQGQTYMCVANIDDVFKKGSTYKVVKIEDGVLHLEDGNKIGIEEAKQIFIKHDVKFTKIDRTEQYDNRPQAVIPGVEPRTIKNMI